jgi:hypothetical protein
VTPLERLGCIPRGDAIFHEIGHLLVGFSIGIVEGGIEFLPPSSGDIARAQCNLPKGEPLRAIMRSLGGMHCQALLCPHSIVEDPRTKILATNLFSTIKSFELTPSLAQQFIDHGFVGDWEKNCAASSGIQLCRVRAVAASSVSARAGCPAFRVKGAGPHG